MSALQEYMDATQTSDSPTVVKQESQTIRDRKGTPKRYESDVPQALTHFPILEQPCSSNRNGGNEFARLIIRAHFMKEILADLRQILPHSRTPFAAIYADRMLSTMRGMRDASPTDPTLDVIMALHDALSYENRWADYDQEQYAGAFQILNRLAAIPRPNAAVIEKTIMALENIGFSTLPFEIFGDAGEFDGLFSSEAR